MVCTHSCPTQPHPKANPTGLAGGDGGIVGHQIAWQGRKLVEHHQSTWPLLPSCLVLMGWWANGLKMKGSGSLGAQPNTPPIYHTSSCCKLFIRQDKSQIKHQSWKQRKFHTYHPVITWSPRNPNPSFKPRISGRHWSLCCKKSRPAAFGTAELPSSATVPWCFQTRSCLRPKTPMYICLLKHNYVGLAWLCLKIAYLQIHVVFFKSPFSYIFPNQGCHLRWQYRPLSDIPIWQLPCPMQCLIHSLQPKWPTSIVHPSHMRWQRRCSPPLRLALRCWGWRWSEHRPKNNSVIHPKKTCDRRFIIPKSAWT